MSVRWFAAMGPFSSPLPLTVDRGRAVRLDDFTVERLKVTLLFKVSPPDAEDEPIRAGRGANGLGDEAFGERDDHGSDDRQRAVVQREVLQIVHGGFRCSGKTEDDTAGSRFAMATGSWR